MAQTFVRKWLKKTVKQAVVEAREEIDRLLAERPSYRAPLSWLRAVVEDLAPDPAAVVFPALAPEAAREKLLAGSALFSGHTPRVDERRFHQRWQRLGKALEQCQPGSVPSGLAAATKRGAVDPNALAAALLECDESRQQMLSSLAAKCHCDPALLTTLLRYAFFPGFAAAAEAAAPLLQALAWQHGVCPVCAGPPLLGELRGLDQSRFLRCGWCAASWEAPRQWCPACGNRDHHSLGFLSQEGDEASQRVATCDACRSAVKMLSTLAALPPLLLLVADAATLHLDLAAAHHGYL